MMCDTVQQPRLPIFAGPNSAGKSTITPAVSLRVPCINADDIKASTDCSDLDAALQADRLRRQCIVGHRRGSIYAYSHTENGVTVEAPEERNPNYSTGTKQQVYEFLQDFTSGGQALQLAGLHAEQPAQLALYSGTILLLTTCCGILVFRRKDLK